MSRPLNKAQLLADAKKEYGKLENLLATLTHKQMEQPISPGGWAVKDFLAHLYEWQQMLFGWYEAGLRGEKPAVPAPGIKWSQLPELNQRIFEKYHDLSREECLALYRESHQKTISFIELLPEADLTTPGLYSWMNQNTLLAYLNSTTAAHYAWAIKDIRKLLQGRSA